MIAEHFASNAMPLTGHRWCVEDVEKLLETFAIQAKSKRKRRS